MPQKQHGAAHLSPYERAICYYSLPKVISPLTFGLIIAYALCIAVALTVVVIGGLLDHRGWTLLGLYALAAMVLFGIVTFTARAFRNAFRQQRYLSEAHAALAGDDDSDVDAIPNPFESHRIFWCDCHASKQLYEGVGGDARLRYLVKADHRHYRWEVQEPEGEEAFSVISNSAPQSFRFGSGLPARMEVYQDGKLGYRIERRFNFRTPCTEIIDVPAVKVAYTKRARGIYVEKRLVGRIYSLRGITYLDIQAEHVCCGVLAYFVSRNC